MNTIFQKSVFENLFGKSADVCSAINVLNDFLLWISSQSAAKIEYISDDATMLKPKPIAYQW